MRNFSMCLMAFGTIMAIFGSSQGAEVPPLISFQDGKVGVNFLGFHAAAGLGGGAGQGGVAGGLHAEAGTPWGQRAAAGLRGNAGNAEGQHTAGELYAGATAGGNIKAAAGIGGAVLGGDQPIAVGKKYAVASAPGIVSGVSENGYSSGGEKVIEKSFVGQQAVQKDYGAQFQASVHKEYSGGYDQNAGQSQAAFVQKEYSGGYDQTAGQGQAAFVQKDYSVGQEQTVQNAHNDAPVGQNAYVVNEIVKTKEFHRKHPRPSFRKHVRYQIDSRFGNEQETSQVQHVPQVAQETLVYQKLKPTFNSFGSAYLDGFLSPQYVAPAPAPALVHAPAQYHTTVEKRVELGGNHNAGSTFFADIFNIPISALGAVSKFLSNSAQHAGNFQVQKTIEVKTHH